MNTSENNELTALRSTMESLKQRLDNQEIINEKLIKNSMKKKMSWLKKYIIFEICLLPLISVLWLGIRYYCHLSWANYFFMLAMCIASVVCDYYINVNSIKDTDYNKSNLIETIKKLTKMKRHRAILMVVSMPLLVIWLLWSGIEAYNALPFITDDYQKGLIYGSLTGGSIGGFIGIIIAIAIFLKMQRTNDDIIKQINDIVNDDLK